MGETTNVFHQYQPLKSGWIKLVCYNTFRCDVTFLYYLLQNIATDADILKLVMVFLHASLDLQH